MRRTREQLRDVARDVAVEMKGMIRRVAIGIATSDRLWQLLGYEDAAGARETFDKTHVFQGVGFSSRPRAGKGEAVLVNIGGRAGHPIVVATRDRSSEPEDLAEDETQLHNSTAQVRMKADGTVHVTDRAGGVAVKMARMDELDSLRTFVLAHIHTSAAAGSPTSIPLVAPAPGAPAAPAAVVGTTKLKSQ